MSVMHVSRGDCFGMPTLAYELYISPGLGPDGTYMENTWDQLRFILAMSNSMTMIAQYDVKQLPSYRYTGLKPLLFGSVRYAHV